MVNLLAVGETTCMLFTAPSKKLAHPHPVLPAVKLGKAVSLWLKPTTPWDWVLSW